MKRFLCLTLAVLLALGLLACGGNAEKEDGKALVIEVKVAESDMGKVIGKQGRIAKAIRSVVKAAAAKEDKKVIVDIA